MIAVNNKRGIYSNILQLCNGSGATPVGAVCTPTLKLYIYDASTSSYYNFRSHREAPDTCHLRMPSQENLTV